VAVGQPTVRIGSGKWRKPASDIVEFRAAAVVTLAGGVLEEDVDVKEDSTVFIRA